ncbi:hypothetical protein O9H85_05115 [Paenibacillus filicis]|uniref:Uncharacterized protein n=1 Tax=Paenibacillus gyeongsangnamensis TaxID=3388067 RepID=A0ABT4Q4K8_9BACL|nr:hypothetical protein [Paenibacillus filicis]MCZ8511811.1 hypothetical protein [Paenibacillus filicis]
MQGKKTLLLLLVLTLAFSSSPLHSAGPSYRLVLTDQASPIRPQVEKPASSALPQFQAPFLLKAGISFF